MKSQKQRKEWSPFLVNIQREISTIDFENAYLFTLKYFVQLFSQQTSSYTKVATVKNTH